MRAIHSFKTILVPLLAWGLAGCAAWPFHHHAAVAVRAAPSGLAVAAGLADDGLYLDARSAIMRRDYATALEALQAAKIRTPDDVRVLNAFGVVYDKLGRFDLSARYYAWAAKLDPQSSIIANNLHYSGYLRAGKTADTTALAQSGRPPSIGQTPYGQAVAAISNGDDPRALAILNGALGQKADDARVLNALGVVNARLGRFDLSEHYYDRAAALDPGSAIVANNREAARLLRAKWASVTHAASHARPATLVVAALQPSTQAPRSPQ
jgi:Flp pilus assembly protein TadD